MIVENWEQIDRDIACLACSGVPIRKRNYQRWFFYDYCWLYCDPGQGGLDHNSLTFYIMHSIHYFIALRECDRIINPLYYVCIKKVEAFGQAMLMSVSSNLTLVAHTPKFWQAKTHFLSNFVNIDLKSHLEGVMDSTFSLWPCGPEFESWPSQYLLLLFFQNETKS